MFVSSSLNFHPTYPDVLKRGMRRCACTRLDRMIRSSRQTRTRMVLASSDFLSASSQLRVPSRRLFPYPRAPQHFHVNLLQSQQLGAVTHFSSYFGNSNKRPTSNNRMAQGAGLMGAAFLLFGKTKYLLAALKFTKLASLGSMVLTIGTYSMFFGWPYAVGIVGLTAIHEAGHAIVLYQKGIPFSPAVFIPFVSAAMAYVTLSS